MKWFDFGLFDDVLVEEFSILLAVLLVDVARQRLAKRDGIEVEPTCQVRVLRFRRKSLVNRTICGCQTSVTAFSLALLCVGHLWRGIDHKVNKDVNI